MRNLWIRRLTAVAGLVAAAWLAAGSAADDALPPDLVKGMAARDIAYLQKELSKVPEKRAVPTLKATAMLLALYAQDTGQGALRDQALKVAGALAKKDYAGAKTAAAGLKLGAAGKVAPVKLHEMHNFDLAELMSTYRNATVGGRNVEKDIRKQGKAVTDTQLVGDIGARVVLVSHYALKMPAERATANAANRKKWEGYSNETQKLASEIASAAAKGAGADKAALAKKLKALDASCTACHNEFRD
ncbi:MAG TPA: cytochrome c [Fimbriiglobus sp.]|nr:cytochrome c [Fimbriiglobus sp.]